MKGGTDHTDGPPGFGYIGDSAAGESPERGFKTIAKEINQDEILEGAKSGMDGRTEKRHINFGVSDADSINGGKRLV